MGALEELRAILGDDVSDADLRALLTKHVSVEAAANAFFDGGAPPPPPPGMDALRSILGNDVSDETLTGLLANNGGDVGAHDSDCDPSQV